MFSFFVFFMKSFFKNILYYFQLYIQHIKKNMYSTLTIIIFMQKENLKILIIFPFLGHFF